MRKYKNRVTLSLFIYLMIIVTILIGVYQIYSIQDKKTEELSANMIDTADQIDDLLITNSMITQSIKNIDLFYKIQQNIILTTDEYNEICKNMSEIISNTQKYIKNVSIIQKTKNFIITSDGIVYKDNIYDETTSGFLDEQILEIYLSKYFSSETLYKNTDEKIISYINKDLYNSNYLILIEIDQNMFLEKINNEKINALSVFNQEGVIFTKNNYDNSENYDTLNIVLENRSEVKLIDIDGHIVHLRKNQENEIIYYMFAENESFDKFSLTSILIIVASILGIYITLVLSKFITKPLNDTILLFENNQDHNINEIEFTSGQIEKVLLEKNKQLEEVFHISRIRKRYNDVAKANTKQEDEEDTEDKEEYLPIYIKSHSKEFEKLRELKDDLKEKLKEEVKYIFNLENEEIIISLNPNQQNIDKVLEEFFQEVQGCFTIVIGKDCKNNEFDVYNQLLKASKFVNFSEKTQIIKLTDKNYTKGNYIFFTQNERKELYNMLFSAEKEKSFEMIKNLLLKNKDKNIKNYYFILCCKRIAHICINTLQDAKDGHSAEVSIDEIFDKLTNLYYFDDYLLELEKFIETISSNMPNVNKADNDEIIVKIKNYVMQNYQENFGLDELSTDLGLSRSYMSSYFKEQTNVNLSTYITNYRIMKSLDLLKSTDLSIQEVSNYVGIHNVNTFIRVFKKYIGETPGSYRKK